MPLLNGRRIFYIEKNENEDVARSICERVGERKGNFTLMAEALR